MTKTKYRDREKGLSIDHTPEGPLFCIDCEVPIDNDNDSRWNAFEIVDGEQRTRPVCVACHEKRGAIGKKAPKEEN